MHLIVKIRTFLVGYPQWLQLNDVNKDNTSMIPDHRLLLSDVYHIDHGQHDLHSSSYIPIIFYFPLIAPNKIIEVNAIFGKIKLTAVRPFHDTWFQVFEDPDVSTLICVVTSVQENPISTASATSSQHSGLGFLIHFNLLHLYWFIIIQPTPK